MELNSNYPLSPISILSGPLPVSVSLQGLNSVKNTLKIWFQFRKHFNFIRAISFLPLANNHLFPPSQIDTAFQVWHKNGLVFFGDLFVEGTFASFDKLRKDHNLPKNIFFRYWHVRSVAKKHFPFPSLPPKNAIDIILDLHPTMKRRVSKIYKTALVISPPPQWDTARLAWEEDLGVTLSDETWQCSLKRIHTTSLCIRHGLIQFKIVHHLHYSPEKLAKIYPGTSPVCPRCGHSPAKLGHMFWSCDSLINFWVRVFEAVSFICDRTVNPDPTVAIFGVFPSEEQANAVAFITLLARRQILLHWKSVRPPSFRHWVKEVLSHYCDPIREVEI